VKIIAIQPEFLFQFLYDIFPALVALTQDTSSVLLSLPDKHIAVMKARSSLVNKACLDETPDLPDHLRRYRYYRAQHPTRHMIGHFGDDFTGRMTKPTVS